MKPSSQPAHVPAPSHGSRLTPPPLPQHSRTAAAAPAQPPPLPQFRSRYLNIEELERFENLLVFAETLVEGWFSGRHKSPHFGFSAEFMEHKPYAHGDAVEHIDWRVYARTRKLFTRKFLEETDMTIHLLVDASPSMHYTGRGREQKFSRVARITAALGYLMLKQGDKAALATFADGLTNHLPPGGTRRHLFRLLQLLEKPAPKAERTDVVRALQEVGSHIRKRGRLVVVSDFLGMDVNAVFDALAQFVHRGFEVMLMQVLDPDELALPDVSLARFVDMETQHEVQVEPEEIRSEYVREIKSLTDTLRIQAQRRRIDYRLLDTKVPYLDAIEAYFDFRRR